MNEEPLEKEPFHSNKSSIANNFPKIKHEISTITREDKLNKLLDLINDIEFIGDRAVIKFNTPVVIASPGDIAIVAGKSLIMKTVEGVIHLN